MSSSVLQHKGCHHAVHFDITSTRIISKAYLKISIDQLLDQGSCEVWKAFSRNSYSNLSHKVKECCSWILLEPQCLHFSAR